MNVAFALQIRTVELYYRRDLCAFAGELAIFVEIGGNGLAAQQTIQFLQAHAQLRELAAMLFSFWTVEMVQAIDQLDQIVTFIG